MERDTDRALDELVSALRTIVASSRTPGIPSGILVEEFQSVRERFVHFRNELADETSNFLDLGRLDEIV